MAVIEELIRAEEDGGISFGNDELEKKTKLSGFEFRGDLYKIKTFHDITRLERNDTVLYESVPGTVVREMKFHNGSLSFTVEGKEDAQITLGMEDDTEYEIFIDGVGVGSIQTSMGGKLPFSVELENTGKADVEIRLKD